jgi:hypothetical protein
MGDDIDQADQAAPTTGMKAELQQLQETAAAAARHPFLPAPARDAIVQAAYVMQCMGAKVLELEAELMNVRRSISIAKTGA